MRNVVHSRVVEKAHHSKMVAINNEYLNNSGRKTGCHDGHQQLRVVLNPVNVSRRESVFVQGGKLGRSPMLIESNADGGNVPANLTKNDSKSLDYYTAMNGRQLRVELSPLQIALEESVVVSRETGHESPMSVKTDSDEINGTVNGTRSNTDKLKDHAFLYGPQLRVSLSPLSLSQEDRVKVNTLYKATITTRSDDRVESVSATNSNNEEHTVNMCLRGPQLKVALTPLNLPHKEGLINGTAHDSSMPLVTDTAIEDLAANVVKRNTTSLFGGAQLRVALIPLSVPLTQRVVVTPRDRPTKPVTVISDAQHMDTNMTKTNGDQEHHLLNGFPQLSVALTSLNLPPTARVVLSKGGINTDRYTYNDAYKDRMAVSLKRKSNMPENLQLTPVKIARVENGGLGDHVVGKERISFAGHKIGKVRTEVDQAKNELKITLMRLKMAVGDRVKCSHSETGR